MRRRDFIKLIGGGAVAWPLTARAENSRRNPQIGVLWHAGSAAEEGRYFTGFVDGLRGLGYVDGINITLEHRFPNEIPERFRDMAAELVSLSVDVLVFVREDIESDESFVIQGRRPDSVGEPPMWTAENRARYDRSRLRYPSDLTDEEWALISPRIPPARRGGNKRTVNLREIVNGLMYILSTGCQWRAIPKDLPPRSTLYDYFDLWNWDGTLDRIHHALYVECRERAEREASPTAAIIDSQSVKSAEKGGLTIRMDMMRARRSRARSDTFSSTRKAS